MFAGNDFKCSGLFEDQSKMLAQELEFSEDAGWNSEGAFTFDDVFEPFLQIDVFLDQEFNEVAVEEYLVGLVELVINSVEIYDFIYLLIIHDPIKEYFIKYQDHFQAGEPNFIFGDFILERFFCGLWNLVMFLVEWVQWLWRVLVISGMLRKEEESSIMMKDLE